MRGEQSDSLFDLRRACLDRRLGELDARLRMLAEVDDSTIDHSFEVATGLTPIEVCEDERQLEQRAPPPEEPQEAQKVAEVQRLLATLRVAEIAGRAVEIAPGVDALVVRADAIEYPALQAETRIVASQVHETLGHWDEAERLLRDAAMYAGKGRDDRLLASIWVRMPYLVGYLEGRPDDAELLGAVTEAALARAGRPSALVQVQQQGLGAMRLRQGELDVARAHYLEALLLLGDDDASSLARAHLLNNLAVIRMQGGFLDEARDLFEQSLLARQGLLRANHPDYADLHQNLATIAISQGDVRFALEHADAGIAIARAAQPDGGPQELGLQLNRSSILHHVGRSGEVRVAVERAVELAERLLPPDHPSWMIVWVDMALVERSEGRFDEARALGRRATALAEATFGADAPQLAAFLFEEGRTELAAGSLARARARFDQALVRFDIEGTEPLSLAEMLRGRGELELREEDLDAARRSFERAIGLIEHHGGKRIELARARFGLARCLPEAERARARALAEQARAQLLEDEVAEDVARIDAWMVLAEDGAEPTAVSPAAGTRAR